MTNYLIGILIAYSLFTTSYKPRLFSLLFSWLLLSYLKFYLDSLFLLLLLLVPYILGPLSNS